MPAPFDTLADSDCFEELCFDLLDAEGFMDLRWRGPAADGGRDIEARWVVQDPAGGLFPTHWYIECKHYTDSVPFNELEPKLLAASRSNADVLLVITSSRIRNTAIDSIDEWLRNRGFPFQVRYWTGRDVLLRLARHPWIYEKHFGARPPGWSEAEGTATWIRAVALAASDRISWRLLPLMQELQARLEALDVVDSTKHGVDLALSLLRAQQTLQGPSSAWTPAKRTVDVAGVLQLACALAERRAGQAFTVDMPAELPAPCSRPLLLSALFELALNAVLYCGDTSPTAALTVHDGTWSIAIRNASQESLPVGFPLLGYRGAAARALPTAGQGAGCWLAKQALERQGMTVGWRVQETEWEVIVSGGEELA